MSFLPAIGTALPPPDIFVPTGFRHIDGFIEGQLPGDCIGLLGASDNAKTIQLIDLAVQNAKTFHSTTVEAVARRKLSVLMSYVTPQPLIGKYIWANATLIPQRELSQLANWSELTTQGNLQPYEYELVGQGRGDGLVLSESERWAMAQVWLNHSFQLLDMTGNREQPDAGAGYVDEIVTRLEQICTEADADIGAVQIDNAQELCTRYMAATGISPSKLHFYLGAIAKELCRRVARPFKCTVWLSHQVNAKVDQGPPTTIVSHWDAMGSKYFAESMASCGCFGVQDPDTGCVLLNWSMLRNDEVNRRPAPVLRIDRDFCRMIDVSDRYVADPQRQSIVDRALRPDRRDRGGRGA